MDNDFVSELSGRLQSHKQFWEDLSSLQATAAWRSIVTEENKGELLLQVGADANARLVFSASIFSQAEDERAKGLAQTIALSSFVAALDVKSGERAAGILADIGNFPGVRYLEEKYLPASSNLLGDLRIALLRNLNSVNFGERALALTDFQLDVWNDLPKLGATSISAPTSSGKSFLVLEYLCSRVARESPFVVVYIAPTRALLAEISRKLSKRLSSMADVRVSTVPALDSEGRVKQVYVLTQERLHVLLSISELNVDLVIVDEAQGLADGTRGMILQDCLERLRRVNDAAQMLLLSPGASGFPEVGRLLGIDALTVKETDLSPVLQYRILVKALEGSANRFSLSLLDQSGITEIGNIATSRGIADPATRLAVAALELGKQGGSLIYATGPFEAERITAQLASDLPIRKSVALQELAKFIRTHIHPEYGLAAAVLHGVTFHYGRMPTLLREALEMAFRSGEITFLVCTTTLFQGVNLPARSVFINTPTRGKGVSLDAAHLWNFAGRAGRLGEDLVGNVFLVDYHNWKSKEFDVHSKYRVLPAFSDVVEKHFSEVIDAINGDMPKLNPRNDMPRRIRSAAGLLLARASSDQLTSVLERSVELTTSERQMLITAATSAVKGLKIPVPVLEANWTMDPYGLQRLANRMREKILSGEVDDLVPIHPREHGAYQRYSGIFNRAAREVLGYKVKTYGGFVATYAIPWMTGTPYPVLLSKWIQFHRRKKPTASINDLVRKAFDFIEDVLRFQMVQLGKAYIDVLRFVLLEGKHAQKSSQIFDYSLALELGVSTTSGRAFIELGTSRITALALEALFPNSELSSSDARTRLQQLDMEAVGLSPVIVNELRQLGLIEVA